MQVDLDAGQEHQVQQPHGTQQDDGVAPCQQVQPVGPDDRTGDDDADDARDAELLHQQRSQQEDQHGYRDDETPDGSSAG
jgi:hypothetical protein